MKKRMLCVLALTMVGLTLNTAEAGGRRGCRGGNCSGGYWGGGYASDGWNGQPANTPTSGGGYSAAYQGEPISPSTAAPAVQQAPVTQASYSIPTSGSASSDAPVNSPGVSSLPSGYTPAYQPAFGGRFSSSCRGGR